MPAAWLHIDDEQRRRRRRRRRLLRGLAAATGAVLVAVLGLSLAPSFAGRSDVASRAAAIAASERAGLAVGSSQLTSLTAAPTLSPAEVTLQVLKPEIAPLAAVRAAPVAIAATARPGPTVPRTVIEPLVAPADVAALRAKLEAPERLRAAPPEALPTGPVRERQAEPPVERSFLRAAAPSAMIRPLVRGQPVVTIIIDDLGNSPAQDRRAMALPAPLTLSFLPDSGHVAALTLEAVKAGHEPFLHLPMEPLGSEDPGPNALLSSQSDADLTARIETAIGRVPNAVGVNNHMGSKLSADPRAMRLLMAALGRRGLSFVDSVTTPATVAGHMALEAGLGVTARDVFLDNDPTLPAIRAQLERTERLARRNGSALAIGHPYPTTLHALEDYIGEARSRGIRFAPATELMALRGCSAGSQATCSLRTIPEALLAARACETTATC